MILEILDQNGTVQEIIRTVGGVAVPQNEVAEFFMEHMPVARIGDREFRPEDGDAYLRAVAKLLDGRYSIPRLQPDEQ